MANRRSAPPRARLAAVGVLALLLLAIPAAHGLTSSQKFFADLLLDDRATGKRVKSLLRSGGGYVNPRVVFRDLTGDDRRDAIVQVHSGGAAGNVALYVFSTHGRDERGELRAVYRLQRLFRSAVRVKGRSLFYRVPRYSPGDELCCPAQWREQELRWSSSKRRFLRRGEPRELDPPKS